MDNSQDRSENRTRKSKTGRRLIPDRHWTLMFIGDHGKVITLKYFKGLVIAGILVVILAVAAVVGFYLFNRTLAQKNRQLEASVQNLRQQLGALRHDNEILMARLVLEQTRKAQQRVPGPDEPADENASKQTEIKQKVAVPRRASEQVKEKPRTAVPPPADKTSAVAATRPKLGVAIENFKIFPVAGSRNLRVQFKLKNTSANSRRVSGHAIVVLKGAQLEPGRWLSIPRQPLVDGKPTGSHRGYAFGINYFRTMKFTARIPRSAEKYDTASVYVYTRAGRLLLEQDFAVKLPAAAPGKAAGPPSPDALLKVLKNTGE